MAYTVIETLFSFSYFIECYLLWTRGTKCKGFRQAK